MNQSTELAGLKGCPFCGGEASFRHDGDPNYPVNIVDSHVEPCPLGFHMLQISYPDEATAAAAWNTRSQPTLTEAPEPLVERLDKALTMDAATATDWQWTELLAVAIDLRAALSSITTTGAKVLERNAEQFKYFHADQGKPELPDDCEGNVDPTPILQLIRARAEDSGEVVQADEASPAALAAYDEANNVYASYMGDPDGNDDTYTAKHEAAKVLDRFARDQRIASQPSVERESYASWQQKRGMLADKVDWAINEYDQFMLDDAYDAQRVLDRIIERLRETRTALATPVGVGDE